MDPWVVDAWWVSAFEVVDKGQLFDFLSLELPDSGPDGFDANEARCRGPLKRFSLALHCKRHSNDHGIELGTGRVGQQGCPTLWTANSRF